MFLKSELQVFAGAHLEEALELPGTRRVAQFAQRLRLDLADAFARHAAARAGLSTERRDSATSQHDLLRTREQRGIVRDQIAEVFHMLRRVGSRAVHELIGTCRDAINGLALG